MRLHQIIKIFLLVLPLLSSAQEKQFKQELERRVQRHEFPSAALDQLNQLAGQISKARFYKETGSSATTFEAKFNWKGSRWSLEFDSLGGFKDIEQTISNRTFRKLMTKTMHEEFNLLGSPYRILKAQRQFSWKDPVRRSFKPEIINPGHKSVIVRYEVEMEVKSGDGRLVVYELLMDEDGRLLRKREIVPLSDKHLLY